MGAETRQPRRQEAWDLSRRQHGVITRRQLLALGFSDKAIKHRIADKRLHVVHRGVYAVGRPELSRPGQLLAAVLSCRPNAVLSHTSALELWELAPQPPGLIHVSVMSDARRIRTDITVHRRRLTPADMTRRHGLPVTTTLCTLIDVAGEMSTASLEEAVNAADRLGLATPTQIRAGLDACKPRPGVRPLRQLLDRRTFRLTDSALERLFIPLTLAAGLRLPQTGQLINGFKVDFYWPELGLVVETDGLRYHRTPAQQARDRVRDQVHVAAGLTCLRFTHAQVKFEPAYVTNTLRRVARRLAR